MKTTQRLDKVLAHMGIGTRSDVRKLAKAGRIEVNGRPAKDSGMQVDPRADDIRVDGERIAYREFVYLMMNKPAGVVSATEDVRERTVLDLLSPEYRHFNPFPVGRLDKDTVGLLLLTNDGKLAHDLLSPRKHVPKTYFAKVDGRVTAEDAEAFARGVRFDDGYVTLPAELRILREGEPERGVPSEVELTIVEGKFHQVKRMFQAVGKRVLFLERIRMGALELDRELARGESRELTERELGLLKNR